MKMDMSKFRKVHSDKDCTTLMHSDGHQLKVAHSRLSKKQRKEIEKIPVHEDAAKYADGGQVKKPRDDIPFNKKAAADFSKGFNEGGSKEFVSGVKKLAGAIGFAGGGGVNASQMSEEQQDSPEKIAADAAAGAVAEEDQNRQPASAPPVVINVGQQPQVPMQAIPEHTFAARMGSQPTPETVAAAQMQAPADLQSTMSAPALQPPATAPEPEQRGLAAQSLAPNQQSPAATPPPGAGSPFSMQHSYGQYMKGLGQEVSAETKLADAQANLLSQHAAAQQELMQTRDQKMAELDQERQSIQKDIDSSHIDPNRFWSNRSTVGKIGTIVGFILGGIGEGLHRGGGNPAIQMFQAQVDKDIESQKQDISNKNTLLHANMQHYKNMEDAISATRLMQGDMIATQLKQEALKQTNPLLKARMLKAGAEWEAKLAPEAGKLIQNQTIAAYMNAAQQDPAKAEQYARVLDGIDPKKAEELRDRMVGNVGLASTKNQAQIAIQVVDRQKNIKENINELKDQIDKYGTFELFGPQNANMDRLVDQIATDMAKLQDPNSVARPGEVELVKKNLISSGLSNKNSTAKSILDKFSKEVDRRAEIALKNSGVQNFNANTKTINGTEYKKVDGGWKRIK
jgi:hypothetical protein